MKTRVTLTARFEPDLHTELSSIVTEEKENQYGIGADNVNKALQIGARLYINHVRQERKRLYGKT